MVARQSNGNKSKEAVLHFLRGFVGEGHRKNIFRARAAAFHQIRDAMDQNPRFAAAGAGQNENRAVAAGHGLALRCIKRLQEVVVSLCAQWLISRF